MEILKLEGKKPQKLNIVFNSFPVEAYISNFPTSYRLLTLLKLITFLALSYKVRKYYMYILLPFCLIGFVRHLPQTAKKIRPKSCLYIGYWHVSEHRLFDFNYLSSSLACILEA